MKIYCIAYLLDDELNYTYAGKIKNSKKLPGFLEATDIVKRYYKKSVPKSILIQLATIYTIYEVDEPSHLKLIQGGFENENVHGE